MRKQILLLALSILFSSCIFSQDKQTVEVKKFDYKAYEISIIKNFDDSYGFKVYGTGGLIIEQLSKPYSKNKEGFIKKENAEKMAKEQIEMNDKGKLISSFTIKDAIRIGISSEDLPDNDK